VLDALGLPIANRVKPAGMSDRSAAGRLLAGLVPLFPRVQTVMADAGHASRKLARELLRDNGWKLQIVKQRERPQSAVLVGVARSLCPQDILREIVICLTQ